MGVSKESIGKFFDNKSISRKFTHPQFWNRQRMLSGEKVESLKKKKKQTNARLKWINQNTSLV